jgi:hypothetical protein
MLVSKSRLVWWSKKQRWFVLSYLLIWNYSLTPLLFLSHIRADMTFRTSLSAWPSIKIRFCTCFNTIIQFRLVQHSSSQFASDNAVLPMCDRSGHLYSLLRRQMSYFLGYKGRKKFRAWPDHGTTRTILSVSFYSIFCTRRGDFVMCVGKACFSFT